MREGLVQRHQLGVELALRLGGIRVVELLGQRVQHIVHAGVAECDGGLAKAHAVLALVRNHYVTGEIFVVDGGLTQLS